MNHVKRFMIVGGNFVNKGAQAMVFTTVSELRKKYPDCKIDVYSNLDYRQSEIKYNFTLVDDLPLQLNAGKRVWYFLLSILKLVLGRKADFMSIITYINNRQKYTALLDISGYALSSKWNTAIVEHYLYNLEPAFKNSIPVFLMPQSFGPLDFKEKSINEFVSQEFPKSQIIFTREEQGYLELQERYHLQNMIPSYDLVLQSRDIEAEAVFKMPPAMNIPAIETTHNIAIIPNMRNFDCTGKAEDEVLRVYVDLINAALLCGKTVYLCRHSTEDILACKKIMPVFQQNKRVIFLENDFNCFEYEHLVEKFDFIVAARYHAVVQAYRHRIPCIVIGWAEKYRELLDQFGQNAYLIDLRKDLDFNSLKSIVQKMNEDFSNEINTIQKKLDAIQDNNCFDLVYKKLNE